MPTIKKISLNGVSYDLGGGLTEEVKQASLQIAEKVAYIDEHGQDYYDELYTAFYDNMWNVTNTLSNAVNSNPATKTPKDGTYTAIISAATGYTLEGATVSVTMGGANVTSSVYSNGTITIPTVTGDVVITVVAVALTVVSISAVYTQSGEVYPWDSLDDLKADLIVTATFSDSSTEIVPSEDYILSGTLVTGSSTVTASYGGKTATFDVTVNAGAMWDYTLGRLPSAELDGIYTTITGSPTVSFVDNVGLRYIGTSNTSSVYTRFRPDNILTAHKSVLELEFKVESVGSNDSSISSRLSNGTNGVAFNVFHSNNHGFVFLNIEGSTQVGTEISGKTWNLNTKYKLRIEYESGGTQYFYLDDEFLYSTSNVSSYYTTSNALFLQGYMTAIIYSMKWMILEA